MKAIKKPIVVECFQYDGDLVNSDGEYYIPDWAIEAYEEGKMYFEGTYASACELFISTLEEDHHVSVGDYVIRGVHGELYPCKPDIFEETYEIVEDKKDAKEQR